MKKLLFVGIVALCTYVSFGLSMLNAAQLPDNNDDFTLERARYYNYGAGDTCKPGNEFMYNNIIYRNQNGKEFYVGGITWMNEKFSVDVFTDGTKTREGYMNATFYYNSIAACQNFNANYKTLMPHILRKN